MSNITSLMSYFQGRAEHLRYHSFGLQYVIMMFSGLILASIIALLSEHTKHYIPLQGSWLLAMCFVGLSICGVIFYAIDLLIPTPIKAIDRMMSCFSVRSLKLFIFSAFVFYLTLVPAYSDGFFCIAVCYVPAITFLMATMVIRFYQSLNPRMIFGIIGSAFSMIVASIQHFFSCTDGLACLQDKTFITMHLLAFTIIALSSGLYVKPKD